MFGKSGETRRQNNVCQSEFVLSLPCRGFEPKMVLHCVVSPWFPMGGATGLGEPWGGIQAPSCVAASTIVFGPSRITAFVVQS
jgi:hypothetical protein